RGYSDPEQLAVSADGSRIYVASEDTGTALIADGQSGDIKASLTVGGEPEGVALSKDGRYVYITSEEGNQIAVIDTDKNAVVTKFAAGKRPRDVAFAPDGATAYITGENDASLTIVDVKRHQPLASLTLPGDNIRPMGVVVSPDGGRVFVATGH